MGVAACHVCESPEIFFHIKLSPIMPQSAHHCFLLRFEVYIDEKARKK